MTWRAAAAGVTWRAAGAAMVVALSVPPSGAPPVEDAARALVLGARLVGDPGDDRRATAAWDWPLVGTPEVARAYDPPVRRWLPGHRGIDLVGVAGEQVLAVDAGVVSYSGRIAGVGVVSVTHASGLRSTYQPVAERVPKGSRLARGAPLGVLDLGGHCVLHDCLHLGARRGETYVDPTPLLQPLTLSLLPLTDRHGGR